MMRMFGWVSGAAFASAVFMGMSMGGAQALPAYGPATSIEVGLPIEQVQMRPGYHRRQEYRREIRRYRDNPGARFITRQKRQQFCRNVPSRC